MHTRIKIIALTILLCGFTVPRPDQKPQLTATEVFEKIQEKYAAVNDASAEFTQTVSFKYAKVEQTFSGKVLMKKGNKYRVESEQQTLVTDGKTVWAYSPVNNQVLIDTYRETQNTFSPEKFLVGLPKNYLATLIDESASNAQASYVLKLSPKSGAVKSVKSLKVWVNDEDWSIRAVEYIDVNETRTTYALKNIHFNADIADARFVFTVPANVEVVDLRSSTVPHE
jgi:outer membrane lipoprotein carrier protein